MKKVIDLGNNVKAEVMEEGIKIISASGSEILLDCIGEFLSYTNQVGLKQAKERKEFFEKFVEIDEEKRKTIFTWLSEYPKAKNEMQENFFLWLGQAMAEVEYDYYIGRFDDADEIIYVLNEHQKVWPRNGFGNATRNEEIIWIAYNIAKGDWTFVEGLAYSRVKNKTLYVLK